MSKMSNLYLEMTEMGFTEEQLNEMSIKEVIEILEKADRRARSKRMGYRLSDKQFEGLEPETRRELMRQMMIVDTPRFRYALGCRMQWWTLVRYNKHECIGTDTWAEGYQPEVIDQWL